MTGDQRTQIVIKMLCSDSTHCGITNDTGNYLSLKTETLMKCSVLLWSRACFCLFF